MWAPKSELDKQTTEQVHGRQEEEKERERKRERAEENKSKSIKYVHRTHIIHIKIQNSTKSNKPNAGWRQSANENSNGTTDFGKTKITKCKQTGGRITAENCVKWEAKDVDEDKYNEDSLVYNGKRKRKEKKNI